MPTGRITTKKFKKNHVVWYACGMGYFSSIVWPEITTRPDLATHPYRSMRREPSKKKKPKKQLKDDPFWVEIREVAFDLYGRVCLKCGSTEQVQMDHVKPKSLYPHLKYDIANLQPLCWPCNREKCDKHETDYRIRFRRI